MTLSNKTTTAITSSEVKDIDALYPDRSATTNAISSTGTTKRLADETPSTTKDMSAAFEWKKGSSDVKGTHAKANQALAEYRRDIENAPNEKDYKPIYYNTFKSINAEREKWS